MTLLPPVPTIARSPSALLFIYIVVGRSCSIPFSFKLHLGAYILRLRAWCRPHPREGCSGLLRSLRLILFPHEEEDDVFVWWVSFSLINDLRFWLLFNRFVCFKIVLYYLCIRQWTERVRRPSVWGHSPLGCPLLLSFFSTRWNLSRLLYSLTTQGFVIEISQYLPFNLHRAYTVFCLNLPSLPNLLGSF